MQLTNQADVHLAVDRGLKRVYVGVPGALIEAGGARVVAAVGSAMFFSDDLPNEGAALLDPTTERTEPAVPRPPPARAQPSSFSPSGAPPTPIPPMTSPPAW